MKDNKQTMTFYVIIVFLLCYFMQLLNFPNVLTVVAGAVLCAVSFFQNKKIKIDVGFGLLTVTMLSYFVIVNGVRGLFFPIVYIPLIIHLIAECSNSDVQKDEVFEKRVLLLILILTVGYAIHGFCNAYMYYAGYVIPGTRQWSDFWTHKIVPGTQHTAYFLPVFALFFPALVYFSKRKVLNIVLIAAMVFFGYTSLATRSRMAVVIFAMVFCIQVLIFAMNEKEYVGRLISGKRFWIAGGVVLIGIAGIAFLMKDSPVVTAFIANMGKGGGILNNVRFEAQRMAILQLFEYPMGGRQMELGRAYCHNTWLDMANAGGLIPFFAFAFYTVYTVYQVIRMIIKKEISTELKLVLVGMYAAFFLYLSVEPALDASIHLVTPWIFVNSLISSVRK